MTLSGIKTTITKGGSTTTAAGVNTTMCETKMVVVADLANNTTGEMSVIPVVQAWGRRIGEHLVSAMAIETGRLLFPFRGEVVGQGTRLRRRTPKAINSLLVSPR